MSHADWHLAPRWSSALRRHFRAKAGTPKVRQFGDSTLVSSPNLLNWFDPLRTRSEGWLSANFVSQSPIVVDARRCVYNPRFNKSGKIFPATCRGTAVCGEPMHRTGVRAVPMPPRQAPRKASPARPPGRDDGKRRLLTVPLSTFLKGRSYASHVRYVFAPFQTKIAASRQRGRPAERNSPLRRLRWRPSKTVWS